MTFPEIYNDLPPEFQEALKSQGVSEHNYFETPLFWIPVINESIRRHPELLSIECLSYHDQGLTYLVSKFTHLGYKHAWAREVYSYVQTLIRTQHKKGFIDPLPVVIEWKHIMHPEVRYPTKEELLEPKLLEPYNISTPIKSAIQELAALITNTPGKCEYHYLYKYKEPKAVKAKPELVPAPKEPTLLGLFTPTQAAPATQQSKPSSKPTPKPKPKEPSNASSGLDLFNF